MTFCATLNSTNDEIVTCIWEKCLIIKWYKTTNDTLPITKSDLVEHSLEQKG